MYLCTLLLGELIGEGQIDVACVAGIVTDDVLDSLTEGWCDGSLDVTGGLCQPKTLAAKHLTGPGGRQRECEREGGR